MTSQTALTLNTRETEQLHALERHFLSHRKKIDDWFKQQWQLTPPPVYGSVDLRNAGFKLAPIDMNLFPAGFNNLNPDFLSHSIKAARESIHAILPSAKKIGVIAESHTRNLRYWSNVKTLQMILENAGFETYLGILNNESTEIILESGEKISLASIQKKNKKILFGDIEPDMILLNNDLSEGIPALLQDIDQTIIPPVQLGWSTRLKSEHFQYYAIVTAEFSELLQIDPWLITPLFRYCGEVDFMQQEGMDCLVSNAEILFAEIEKKYRLYNISYQPFLIVKADAGTYGMAVMTVRNMDELKSMNRKQRTKMSMTKGSQPVRRVIIQEGVYTFETFGKEQSVAEPVVYLWGSCVVGGFYRVHKEKREDENLNSPGMEFQPLAFAETCTEPREELEPDACPNRFYAYGIVAELSMLAAAREMKEYMKK